MERRYMKFRDNRTSGKTDLRQAQLVMLMILRIVDDICRRHSIQYWLDGGTALGAFRHKGFIPWDDDLDISMLRQDYTKFLSIARQELPGSLFLQVTGEDQDYYIYWAKIRDKYSTKEEPEYYKADFHQGIYIDIFPCDFYPKTSLLGALEKFIARSLQYRCRNFHSGMGFSEKMRYIAGRILCVLVPYRIEKCIFAFFRKAFRNNDFTIGYGVGIPFRRRYEYNEIFPLKHSSFEGFLFPVPNGIEQYLADLYGDFRKLPDVLDRKPHSTKIMPTRPCRHKEVLHWN
ncbi:MAG: LicD family protein [Deltaproteobacteria bacterium]|nr:LicD family protein [Deltaproteobacteria bacterium]